MFQVFTRMLPDRSSAEESLVLIVQSKLFKGEVVCRRTPRAKRANIHSSQPFKRGGTTDPAHSTGLFPSSFDWAQEQDDIASLSLAIWKEAKRGMNHSPLPDTDSPSSEPVYLIPASQVYLAHVLSLGFMPSWLRSHKAIHVVAYHVGADCNIKRFCICQRPGHGCFACSRVCMSFC